MPTTLEQLNARLIDADREALARCIVKRNGRQTMRKTPPDWRKDPHAWAAWQGIRTAVGRHGEAATFGLLMLPPDARETWDRVSDAALTVRRLIEQ